jgi:hypothetical protein
MRFKVLGVQQIHQGPYRRILKGGYHRRDGFAQHVETRSMQS